MKIEIDTKRDSVHDIKKTIDFLLKFVDEGRSLTEDLPTVGDGSFNMFSDSSSTNDDNDDKEDETPSVSVVEY
ncbi:hypothetical protein H8D36_06305 [archaeon]|nr:hypothetical protein [archaeon]